MNDGDGVGMRDGLSEMMGDEGTDGPQAYDMKVHALSIQTRVTEG